LLRFPEQQFSVACLCNKAEINPSDLTRKVADVFERDLPLVREGANATVVFPSMHDELSGRVASIGAVVSSGLRTAPVRVAVDSNGMTLRPGMYGKVTIELRREPETPHEFRLSLMT
jgi:multidrug efflux pump subunit AcrA (membrane-fusion protein)